MGFRAEDLSLAIAWILWADNIVNVASSTENLQTMFEDRADVFSEYDLEWKTTSLEYVSSATEPPPMLQVRGVPLTRKALARPYPLGSRLPLRKESGIFLSGSGISGQPRDPAGTPLSRICAEGSGPGAPWI